MVSEIERELREISHSQKEETKIYRPLNHYSSLVRNLFDSSGLPNHGGDGKPDLVHAVCNFIDGAWIDPWRDQLDAVVIDAMSATFHLPKSTKFESFQMLSLSFIN